MISGPILAILPILAYSRNLELNGTKYLRMDQVKLVKGSL